VSHRATYVNEREATDTIKSWLQSERLEVREVKDPQAVMHLHVRYPPTKQGHLFNIVIPKNRNLALIYSITRVDEGQQKLMAELSSEDNREWESWLHETRLTLASADLDWVLHVGKPKKSASGPLQAFNLSRPIWFDGLTQNEFMHTLRKVWLTKLSLIHQIKFEFGPGIGKPGPVDDWAKKRTGKSQRTQQRPSEIDTDETGGFGKDFDPLEWA